VSRITDLIAHAKAKDPQMGADLEREFKALSSRLAFGLNFERHRPEAVELPQRSVRKGDKVQVLPKRGSTKKGDQQLWTVRKITNAGNTPLAHLESLNDGEKQTKDVSINDLAVVAEFRDLIYPGLASTGKVQRGGDKPFHTVINGENYHALKTLSYTHRGKVDAIYIDPPYNTGAKDWKYNNDYVEGDDLYRHSKWLAMMERRLLIAKELLNPSDSVLIVSIDEKEYLRLGLLLEQTFPEGNIQMVSSVINRKGVVRTNELTRTNEFIYFVKFGSARLAAERQNSKGKVRWASLRRFEDSSRRNGPQPRPDQFYPIFVGAKSGRIESVGTSLSAGVDRSTIADKPNCLTVWPVKPDGTEMIWGLTPATLKKRLAEGLVKVIPGKRGKKPTLYYLTSGQVAELASGDLVISGHDPDGSVVVEFATGKASLPTTQWDRESHNAQPNGTGLLTALLPSRKFPYAKSLYAVEDCLRLAVAEKAHGIVVDFFAGSGTTTHAVMRLNRQDGGRRQCICVTNNEVAADEQLALRKQGLRPGDADWERWGICEYITKPRIEAAITGRTPEGKQIEGIYKFLDEFPMCEGFSENAEFFTLTYASSIAVSHNLAFGWIAPLLWLRAGSEGRRIDILPPSGWDVVDTYGLLVDLDQAAKFCKAVDKKQGLRIAYIVTDDDRRFQAVARRLPVSVETVRLYESYLMNFQFANGE
jgi:adenine-specific DNA-methyltransferase